MEIFSLTPPPLLFLYCPTKPWSLYPSFWLQTPSWSRLAADRHIMWWWFPWWISSSSLPWCVPSCVCYNGFEIMHCINLVSFCNMTLTQKIPLLPLPCVKILWRIRHWDCAIYQEPHLMLSGHNNWKKLLSGQSNIALQLFSCLSCC